MAYGHVLEVAHGQIDCYKLTNKIHGFCYIMISSGKSGDESRGGISPSSSTYFAYFNRLGW